MTERSSPNLAQAAAFLRPGSKVPGLDLPVEADEVRQDDPGSLFQFDSIVAKFYKYKQNTEPSEFDVFHEMIKDVNKDIYTNEQFSPQVVEKFAQTLFDQSIKSINAFLSKKTGSKVFVPPTDTENHEVVEAHENLIEFDKNFRDHVKRMVQEVSVRLDEQRKKRSYDALKGDSDDDDDDFHDRGRSRDRRRKKKKSKKHSRKSGKSSSSSHSDSASSRSARREKKKKEVQKILKEHGLDKFRFSMFPDPKLILEVHKRRKEKTISSKPIEVWVPTGVGSKLSSAAQKKFREDRMKSSSMTIAELIENTIAFWLAHSISGIVKFESILTHITILTEIAQRETQLSAVQYERALLLYIKEEIFKEEITNVDDLLTKIVTEVDSKKSESFSGSTRTDTCGDPKGGSAKGGKKGKGRTIGNVLNKLQTIESVIAGSPSKLTHNLDRAFAKKGAGKGAGKGDDRRPTAFLRPNAQNRRINEPCKFWEAGHCVKGASCPFVHNPRTRGGKGGDRGRDRSGPR